MNRWAQKDQQAYEHQAYQQQAAAAAPPTPAPAPASAGSPPLSQAEVLDQLKQLGELKAAGVLTEEEFAMQKARILAGVR